MNKEERLKQRMKYKWNWKEVKKKSRVFENNFKLKLFFSRKKAIKHSCKKGSKEKFKLIFEILGFERRKANERMFKVKISRARFTKLL
jgi:hypothetical protein